MKIKCNGQDILSNNFTDKDKKKLDSVQFCANNYKHPIRDGYKHLPAGGQEGQVVMHDGTNATWKNFVDVIPDIDNLLAYGVQFDTTIADPHLTRIGNMSLHKSLPIQSQLKGCIAQGGKIIYWLNESDWRFRKEAITKSVEITVAGDVYTMVSDVFHTLQYDKQWIKVDEVACQISSIDTSTNTATLLVNDDLKALSLSSATKSIELGAVLNGYDGTVRIYCPEFYIKSIVKDTVCKVYISTTKIDDTYTHQPAVLIDAYGSTVLNTVPENMGYLSTLAVHSAISVVNNNTYCRGGENDSVYDEYLATDPFLTLLGKPRTNISRGPMRTCARNANSQLLSYDQYKNIFYWLYVVEYANFNSQEAYNATLTDEGYHQGGMGAGITTMRNGNRYNGNNPITPCGYGNTLGNRTGLVSLTVPSFISGGSQIIAAQPMQMARWRGFDNPFGDILTNLDGIIIDADADNHPNNMNYVYTCQDASKYADTLNDSYVKVGEEIHQDGYTKSFDLGDAAHIIPHVMGGDTTEYICDKHWTGSKNKTLRTLLVGSLSNHFASGGLGYFCSNHVVSFAYKVVGFRTVSEFVSFPSDK